MAATVLKGEGRSGGREEAEQQENLREASHVVCCRDWAGRGSLPVATGF